jgi:hypothetical protein
VGVNTYDTVIVRDGQPVNELPVYLRMTNPERDWRGEWHIAENIDDGLYVSSGGEIDRKGEWLTLIDIGGTAQRVVFEWEISAETAVIDARAPNWLNLLALFGIVVAAGYAVLPLARRFYRKLDLSPTSMTVAVGAVALTTVVVIVGIAAAQNAAQQYELTVNPLPQVVNSVLPNSESLARGEALLDAECGGWQETADWDELIRRLPRLRDEELSAFTHEGWRTLAPCQSELTENARWDVVNFVRAQELVLDGE